MKMQTKAIVASVIVLALTMSAVSGVAYSWWSDSEDATIHITTGGMDVTIPSYTIEKQIDGTADPTWGSEGTKTISGTPSNIQISAGDITPPSSSTGVNTFIVKYTATFKTTISAKYYIGMDEIPVASGVTISHSLSDGVTWNSFNDLNGSADSTEIKEVNVTITIEIANASFADITLKIRNYITQSTNPVIYGGSTSGSTTTFNAGSNTSVTVIPEEINFEGTSTTLPASGEVKAGTHKIEVTGSALNSVTISDLVFKSNRVSADFNKNQVTGTDYNDFAVLAIDAGASETVVIDNATFYGAFSIVTKAKLIVKNSMIYGTINGYINDNVGNSITFDNCIFDSTKSEYTDITKYYSNNADAIWYKVEHVCDISFINCTFTGNRAIHIEDNGKGSNVVVTGCTFNLTPYSGSSTPDVELKKTKAIYLVHDGFGKITITGNKLSIDSTTLICYSDGFNESRADFIYSPNTDLGGTSLSGEKLIKAKNW